MGDPLPMHPVPHSEATPHTVIPSGFQLSLPPFLSLSCNWWRNFDANRGCSSKLFETVSVLSHWRRSRRARAEIWAKEHNYRRPFRSPRSISFSMWSFFRQSRVSCTCMQASMHGCRRRRRTPPVPAAQPDSRRSGCTGAQFSSHEPATSETRYAAIG
jgi:hypothetical protein